MSRPSTRNLQLPEPARLERLCQSLAVLDAILCPEWEFRYFSFNQDWDPEREQRMGSMRNGCGDDYFILFTSAGAAIKGFAHEYPMATYGAPPAGVFDGFPAEIEGFLNEPAFMMDNTTFCIWCSVSGQWSIGSVRFPEGHDDPDGSEFLLELLTDEPADYQRYARDYFEVDVPLEHIERIYAYEPVTEALVRSLNTETCLEDLADDFAEIGYPVAASH